MGRSTETFSKKEREKKKAKKQLDKKEKAEDRKSNTAKGKGLDDMMAYVDEDGNITSTPPDPSKKRKISVDDIQIGVPKQEDIVEEIERNGSVSFFNDSKGYGFIRDLQSQESVFVHINALSEPIKEGDKVTFEIERGPKGLTAVKVKKKAK
ncbi:cold shock domain-containing protein [Mucilaginibacter sp. CSA2-8R]|uniref:cold-shock protein n=1 Tax=Mucilaginibacter sp. CSA2-8R TaxID=3141542 RepID=UPI00315DE7EB